MAKLHRLDSNHLLFLCPACKCPHYVRVEGYAPMWEWNGDMDAPSFTPDMIFSAHGPAPRCHFMVKDGTIEFYKDSGHELAGFAAPMLDWVGK